MPIFPSIAYTVAVCMLAFPSGAFGQGVYEGVPAQARAQIVKLLPARSKVESVLSFKNFDRTSSSVALLISRKEGWEIYVISPSAGSRYFIEWRSGSLPSTFDVATPELTLHEVDGHDAIAFQGCEAHRCDEVFSSLLYVPSLKRAFSGTCHDGETEFSFTVAPPTTKIRSLLGMSLRKSDIEHKACSPEISNTREEAPR